MFLVHFLCYICITVSTVISAPTITVVHRFGNDDIPRFSDVLITNSQRTLRLDLQLGPSNEFFSQDIENDWERMRNSCNSSSTKNSYGWNANKGCIWASKWQWINEKLLRISFQLCSTYVIFEDDVIRCAIFNPEGFVNKVAPVEPLSFSLSFTSGSQSSLRATTIGYTKPSAIPICSQCAGCNTNPCTVSPCNPCQCSNPNVPCSFDPASPTITAERMLNPPNITLPSRGTKELGPAYAFEFSTKRSGFELILTLRNDAWDSNKSKQTFLSGFTCLTELGNQCLNSLVRTEHISFSHPIPTIMVIRVPPTGPSFDISSDQILKFEMTPSMTQKGLLPTTEVSVSFVFRAVKVLQDFVIEVSLQTEHPSEVRFDDADKALSITEDCLRGVDVSPTCTKLSYRFRTSTRGADFIFQDETKALFASTFKSSLGQFEKVMLNSSRILIDSISNEGSTDFTKFWVFKVGAMPDYDCNVTENVTFSFPQGILNLYEPPRLPNGVLMNFSIIPSPGWLIILPEGTLTMSEECKKLNISPCVTETQLRSQYVITFSLGGESWLPNKTLYLDALRSLTSNMDEEFGWNARRSTLVVPEKAQLKHTFCCLQHLLLPLELDEGYDITKMESISLPQETFLQTLSGLRPKILTKLTVVPVPGEISLIPSNVSERAFKYDGVTIKIILTSELFSAIALSSFVAQGMTWNTSKENETRAWANGATRQRLLTTASIKQVGVRTIEWTVPPTPEYETRQGEMITVAFPSAFARSGIPFANTASLTVVNIPTVLTLTTSLAGSRLAFGEDVMRKGGWKLVLNLENDIFITPIESLYDLFLSGCTARAGSPWESRKRFLTSKSTSVFSQNRMEIAIVGDPEYDLSSPEIISCAFAGSNFYSGEPVVGSPVLNVSVTPGEVVALSPLTPTINEQKMREGGTVYTLGLIGDTWTCNFSAVAESMSGNDTDAYGWNARKKNIISGVTATSCGATTRGVHEMKVSLQADEDYDIATDEVVTFFWNRYTIKSGLPPSGTPQFFVNCTAGTLILTGETSGITEKRLRRGSDVVINIFLIGERFSGSAKTSIVGKGMSSRSSVEREPSGFNKLQSSLVPLSMVSIDPRGYLLTIVIRSNNTYDIRNTEVIQFTFTGSSFLSGLTPTPKGDTFFEVTPTGGELYFLGPPSLSEVDVRAAEFSFTVILEGDTWDLSNVSRLAALKNSLTSLSTAIQEPKGFLANRNKILSNTFNIVSPSGAQLAFRLTGEKDYDINENEILTLVVQDPQSLLSKILPQPNSIEFTILAVPKRVTVRLKRSSWLIDNRFNGLKFQIDVASLIGVPTSAVNLTSTPLAAPSHFDVEFTFLTTKEFSSVLSTETFMAIGLEVLMNRLSMIARRYSEDAAFVNETRSSNNHDSSPPVQLDPIWWGLGTIAGVLFLAAVYKLYIREVHGSSISGKHRRQRDTTFATDLDVKPFALTVDQLQEELEIVYEPTHVEKRYNPLSRLPLDDVVYAGQYSAPELTEQPGTLKDHVIRQMMKPLHSGLRLPPRGIRSAEAVMLKPIIPPTMPKPRRANEAVMLKPIMIDGETVLLPKVPSRTNKTDVVEAAVKKIPMRPLTAMSLDSILESL